MSIPNNLTKTIIHKLSERDMRSLLQTLVPVHRKVVQALKDAEEHLKYCGWGDNWERECATDAGLPVKISTALTASQELRL